jgi:CRISPR-associated protein Cmr6
MEQRPERCPDNAHHGLWFDRFINGYDSNWQLKADKDHDAKRQWIDTVADSGSGPCGDRDQLSAQQLRRDQLARAIGGQTRCYSTDWHFATGLGLPHPVENGLLWHPTLGVPYLTGAAVKGMVRAFAETWMDPIANPRQRQSWFGSQQHGDIPEQAGDYIYFDALPIAPIRLIGDIMTPHMGNWYQQGGGRNALDRGTCPGDWHEPVPIPFLVVKDASFQFAIAPRGPHGNPEDLTRLLDLLDQALAWIGAGAKTAVGYGSMGRAPKEEASLQQRREDISRQQAERKRRQTLSPAEQQLQAWIDQTKTDNLPIALLQQLESGAWNDKPELQAAAARHIMEQWQTDKKWHPEFTGSNAKKVKQRDRCNKVLGYLPNTPPS